MSNALLERRRGLLQTLESQEDLLTQPFTVTATDSCRLKIFNVYSNLENYQAAFNYIKISINGGTWDTNPPLGTGDWVYYDDDGIQLSAGDTVAIKIDVTNLSNYQYSNNILEITDANGNTPTQPLVDLSGNIMSLKYGDNFVDNYDFASVTDGSYASFQGSVGIGSAENLLFPSTVLPEYCYYQMFYNCTTLTKTPLLLPGTAVNTYAYYSMFQGCSNITTSPDIQALTMANNSMSYMFYGCSNLNWIKAMFTTTPGRVTNNSWVRGVASSGTFVKNSSATWNVSGIHGVPTGWTIEYADA